MVRRRLTLVLRPFMVLVMVAALPSAVVAGDKSARVGSGAGSGDHCVRHLEYIEPTGPQAYVASETCFSTFAESMRHATGGHTKLNVDAKPNSVTQGDLPAAGTAATIVLGIDWDWVGYKEESILWEASTGCDAGHWYVVGYVGNAWNDRIESAKGFNGCVRFRHFEHQNYGGAKIVCTPNCFSMGTMTRETSSLHFDN